MVFAIWSDFQSFDIFFYSCFLWFLSERNGSMIGFMLCAEIICVALRYVFCMW